MITLMDVIGFGLIVVMIILMSVLGAWVGLKIAEWWW